jgi:putative membrane-bound dehydrogenase-like protein
MPMHAKRLLSALLTLLAITSSALADEPLISIGVAAEDITPNFAVRLSGYGGRRAESDGIEQRIWAKALAIGSGPDTILLITVDNLGVPDSMARDLAQRLKSKDMTRERIAICSSHTHCAPMLTNVAPTLFGMPIPPEHQHKIDRYTRELLEHLEKLSAAALADRKPGRLSWAKTKVAFAANRRTPGGLVDHDLPVMKVLDADGKLRALWVNYACHCTTLGGEFNKIHGDWAGVAQELLERAHPGAAALVSIGCGADSNPQPRGNLKLVEQHGEAIAKEVDRLLAGPWKPLHGPVAVRFDTVELPFDKLPTREEWEKKAKQPGAVGYHAQVQLKRLDRGEALPTKIAYPIQTWTFGDNLAMVFLAGEVVVDYSLRLKKEYDAERLWVNAYSNDATCYIPSQRILKEGGYEGGGAMIYYDRPTRFAPAVEDVIITALRKQIPASFKAPKDPKEFPPPKRPEDSRKTLHTKPGFKVELVASEPMISSPVAIDWGPDGRLWVVEMYDYPTGTDGDYKPGGRVKYLESTKGDGKYDRVTVLADNLPFPTGLMAWRGGVLVCAAPDILYLEDTKRDGKCDVRRVLLTGFVTENYQARVNGLSLGLDNSVYGANGLLGGRIYDPRKPYKVVDLGGRDFRMKPDTGEFEPASGLTQQGRVRDDWDNWFGGDNSNLLRHFPLPDHYLRRNPHVAGPPPFVDVLRGGDPDPNKLFPTSHMLKRFNDFGAAGRVTSACSPLIYRDNLLGQEYYGNAFICEPVHNLVTRRVLEPKGTSFIGRRAPDEQSSEFLASSDNWFRPVQVRTGPDGALWVVDMYRFVIEHPRWIPADRLAELDVRAGADMGRIYRIYPENNPPRTVPRLDKLSREELVRQFGSPNGHVRDLAQRLIVERKDRECISPLVKFARECESPLGRMHALCALDGMGAVRTDLLTGALSDRHPGVRRQTVRLLEEPIAAGRTWDESVARLAGDADIRVRFQWACSLGALNDDRGVKALAQVARMDYMEPYVRAALLSSINRENYFAFVGNLLARDREHEPVDLFPELFGLLPTFATERQAQQLLALLLRDVDGQFAEWQMRVVARVCDSLARHGRSLDQVAAPSGGSGISEKETLAIKHSLGLLFRQARSLAADPARSLEQRRVAIRMLGRNSGTRGEDLPVLASLLSPQTPPDLQIAAAEELAQVSTPEIPTLLLRQWQSHSPSLRSRILDLFLNREQWLPTLLDAARVRAVSRADLGTVRTQQLLSHRNEMIRTQAAAVLKVSLDPDRQKVVDSYRAAIKDKGLDKADAIRGAEAFKKTCSICHKIGDVGEAIGPDLAALTDRTTEALLIAILDPNRAVDGRYMSFLAVTKRGLQFTGMLLSESATNVTLVGPEGKKQEILRTELEEFTNTGKSLMPEGLERDINSAAMADLIAYLQTLGRRPKKVPGNEPRLVKSSPDGTIHLKASDCEIYGGEITFETDFGNLGMWHGAGDHAVWSLEVPAGGKYRVEMNYACDIAVAGNRYVLSIGGVELAGKVGATGHWSDYRNAKIGELELSPGRYRLTFRSAGELRGALLDLREVRLVPVK